MESASISNLEKATYKECDVFRVNYTTMPHPPPAVRGMKFTCARSWESMTQVDGGRFCESCQKPVIDFTAWKREDLIAYFKGKPETCGQFEPYQVDPTLIPLEDVGKGFRRGFFASIAALALNSSYAQDVPAPAATEQVTASPNTGKRIQRSTDHLTSHPRKTWDVSPVKPPEPKRKKYRTYVSWRFPFLHVVKRHIRGKRSVRTLGCPSF